MAITWLDDVYVRQLQRAQIDEHGGASYHLRDEGAFESTLVRPINRIEHEPDSSLFRLAASYGCGFCKNHCFVDGNKRIALVSIDVFLILNGWELDADEMETHEVIYGLAAGDLGEDELATWIEMRAVPFDIDAE